MLGTNLSSKWTLELKKFVSTTGILCGRTMQTTVPPQRHCCPNSLGTEVSNFHFYTLACPVSYVHTQSWWTMIISSLPKRFVRWHFSELYGGQWTLLTHGSHFHFNGSTDRENCFIICAVAVVKVKNGRTSSQEFPSFYNWNCWDFRQLLRTS